MKKEMLKEVDLYFITDRKLTKKRVLDDVQAAVNDGVKIVQYREKNKAKKEMIEEAGKIKEICGNEVILLINDDVEVSLAIDADGVHIGKEDVAYEKARKLLGEDKIIGIYYLKISKNRLDPTF